MINLKLREILNLWINTLLLSFGFLFILIAVLIPLLLASADRAPDISAHLASLTPEKIAEILSAFGKAIGYSLVFGFAISLISRDKTITFTIANREVLIEKISHFFKKNRQKIVDANTIYWIPPRWRFLMKPAILVFHADQTASLTTTWAFLKGLQKKISITPIGQIISAAPSWSKIGKKSFILFLILALEIGVPVWYLYQHSPVFRELFNSQNLFQDDHKSFFAGFHQGCLESGEKKLASMGRLDGGNKEKISRYCTCMEDQIKKTVVFPEVELLGITADTLMNNPKIKKSFDICSKYLIP